MCKLQTDMGTRILLPSNLTHAGHIDCRFYRRHVFRAPQRRDSLELRVKLHTALAVKVEIALDTATTSRERKHWERDWNGHIDALVSHGLPDLAHIDFMGKLARDTSGLRKDARPVSVGVCIDHLNG